MEHNISINENDQMGELLKAFAQSTDSDFQGKAFYSNFSVKNDRAHYTIQNGAGETITNDYDLGDFFHLMSRYHPDFTKFTDQYDTQQNDVILEIAS